jgi:hypothetical protein
LPASILTPADFRSPAVLLSGTVDYAMYNSFRDQLECAPAQGLVVIELSTLGGYPHYLFFLASSAYRASHWWALPAPTVGAANERHNHGFEVKRNGFRLTPRGTSRRRGSSESKITKARKAPEPIRKCWYTTPSPCRRTSLRRPFHLDRSPKQAFHRRRMLSRICLPNTPASAHANLPE